MTQFDYDLFVIGGGSGGVRAARRVAALGKKVAIAEEYRFGGTCVIRGCVPKKLYVYASQQAEHIEDARGYGYEIGDVRFDWKQLVASKEAEITRLEGLYKKGLDAGGAERIDSRAVLTGPNSVKLLTSGEEVTAERILIAVGGYPNPNHSLKGHELCVTSDDVFDLEEFPKRIVIAGAGYIAVEFACIFAGLGSEVSLVFRRDEPMHWLDDDISKQLIDEMLSRDIKLINQSVIEEVSKDDSDSLSVALTGGKNIEADQVLLAMGRLPHTAQLGLDAAGVEQDERGYVKVDEYSRTNVPNILAVGDVTDRVQLTPVAIHESMCLIETEFKDNPTRPDHELVPTAIFSQPEIGTVGLSEAQAVAQFDAVSVFLTRFRPMKFILPGRQSFFVMKLIVRESDDVVVGAHVIGPEAGEMAQLLGVILKSKCTKANFDQTMALHPCAAEELVTMYDPSYRIVEGKRLD